MRRKINLRIPKVLIIIFILLIAFCLICGYRFTPMQALKANPFLKDDLKVIGEVNKNWVNVFILETQDGIKTATVLKSLITWRCPSVTYLYDDIIKDDKVKTVGWTSFNAKNGQITVFAVQTTDPDVKYIEAGQDSERQRKDIHLNETIIFVWDKAVRDLNAIAFSQDNKQLYKYSYDPAHPNFTDQKDLRWYQSI